jgi:hypothetical protein
VERGEERVDDGVEIFMPEGGEDFQVDAAVFELAWRDVMRTTIDGDMMAARDEPRRELFGESLKAPVARGHAPCS